jgi:hypothetical protein
MALKDAAIRKLCAESTPKKKADETGLYIEIFPNGSRHRRLKFRFAGEEKRLALGAYPEVSVVEARRQRDIARSKIRSVTRCRGRPPH